MEAAKFEELKERCWQFMQEYIYPSEQLFAEQCEAIGHAGNEWTHAPILVELKKKAKALGLWNLFLPVDSAKLAGYPGAGLTNRQYAEICEILGTSNHAEFASEVTNCTSPDTGNMEVLARYGTTEQKERWLKPLLEGDIRSCYAMTEPNVASSDASNIGISIVREGDEYVINGEKWWITGAGSLHCKIMILMGKTNPQAKAFRQQSQILVPMDTPGITLLRPLKAFGHDDAPKGHFHILFENVRVPVSNVLLGEGRGFEIAQGRLGPGRIHHCMRHLGQAERAISLMVKRVQNRKAFGKKLADFDNVLELIAKSRGEIDQCRLLTQTAAQKMDELGNKDAYTRQLLALVKAMVPAAVATVVDRAIQMHGGMGTCQDAFLATSYFGARALRIADGPDEVHFRTAARIELERQRDSSLTKSTGYYPVDRTRIFRRSTDPISPATLAKL
jgi:alkylation response protein AidB-like acyl-CoA dehydrogenase